MRSRAACGAALALAATVACTREVARPAPSSDAGGRDVAPPERAPAPPTGWAPEEEGPRAAPPGPPPRSRGLPGASADLGPVRLFEAPPSGYRLDGDVSEWASDAPPAAPGSRAGLVWVALTESGLYVAGEVDARSGGAPLEHLRLNLALAPPELPPLAFVNHLDAAVVDAAWCRTQGTTFPGDGSPDGGPSPEVTRACLAWLSRCEALRRTLAERFQRTIDVDLASGKATGVNGARVEARPASDGGSTFEIEVPLAAMPETSEMPLRTLRVATRAYASAGGEGGPRDDAPPWARFELPRPLRLHRAPDIVEHVLSEARASGAKGEHVLAVAASYVPSATSTHVSYFFNVGVAGQWTPEETSPQVGDLDVTRGRKLATLPACLPGEDGGAGQRPCAHGGAIELAVHPTFFDDTNGLRLPDVSLVSRRGDAILDVSASTAFEPYASTRREPGLHTLSIYRGPAGPYGSGPSGAATGFEFQIVTMDADGRFADAKKFPLMIHRGYVLGVDGLPGFDGQVGMSDVDVRADHGLASFGLAGTFFVEGLGEVDAGVASFERGFEAGYRWDSASRAYKPFGRVRATRDAAP